MADRVDVVFSAQFGDAVAGIEAIRTELETLGTAAESLIASFTGMGEAIAAALAVDKLVGMAAAGLKLGEALDTASQQLGITTDELQVLKFQGDLTNVSFDQLTRVLPRFALTLQTAQSGAGPAAAALQALGLNADYLKLHSNDLAGILTTVAQRLDEYSAGANKSAIETAIFGQRGGELIPFLTRLASGLDVTTQEAREAGVVLGHETVANLAAAEEAANKYQAQLKVLQARLAETFTPNVNNGLSLLYNVLSALLPNIDADVERLGKMKTELAGVDQEVAKLREQAQGKGPFTGFDPAMQLNAALERRTELLDRINKLQLKVDQFRPPKADTDTGDKPEAPALPNEAALKLSQKIAMEDQRARDQMMKEETQSLVQADEQKYSTDKAYYDRVSGLFRTQYQLHQISLSEETQGLREAEDQRYASQLDSLHATLSLYGQDEAGYKKTAQEIEKAAIDHARSLEQINGQAALKIQQQFQQIASPIIGSFGNAVSGMLLKTETLQQGIANIGSTIVSTMVNKVINYIVDEWIIAEGVKLLSSQTTADSQVATATGAATTAAAVKKAWAVSEIMADAAVAAAGASAATAAIPFIGPELAPEAAAAAYADTSAWSGAVLAEGGMWNVPSDEFPILAHAGESVLPANIAESMREFFGGGQGGGSGHTFNITTNAYGSNATPDAIAAAIQKAVRNFTLPAR